MFDRVDWLGVALAGRAFVRGSEPPLASCPCGLQSRDACAPWPALRAALASWGKAALSPAARRLASPWESRPGQALTGWRYRRFGRFHAERLVLRLQVLAAVLQQFTQFGTTATVALVFIHLGPGGPVRNDDFARPWLTFRGGG